MRPDAGKPTPGWTFTPAPAPTVKGNLDGHWDRRLEKGGVQPDVTIDLHGHSLASAYARLDLAIGQAVAADMRLMLLVTGKARAPESGRGAIRAAVSDWLASSRHAGDIAAVRNAHPRHGGDGALYIVLRRRRG
jgi:DNA-nicking Smr family endonuclease